MTEEERLGFRLSIAAIEEFFDPQEITFEDKKNQKIRTKKFTSVRDDALGFLKELADKSLKNRDRRKICEGLGFFDNPDISGKIDEAFAVPAQFMGDLAKMLGTKFPPANPKGPWIKFFRKLRV